MHQLPHTSGGGACVEKCSGSQGSGFRRLLDAASGARLGLLRLAPVAHAADAEACLLGAYSVGHVRLQRGGDDGEAGGLGGGRGVLVGAVVQRFTDPA